MLNRVQPPALTQPLNRPPSVQQPASQQNFGSLHKSALNDIELNNFREACTNALIKLGYSADFTWLEFKRPTREAIYRIVVDVNNQNSYEIESNLSKELTAPYTMFNMPRWVQHSVVAEKKSLLNRHDDPFNVIVPPQTQRIGYNA